MKEAYDKIKAFHEKNGFPSEMKFDPEKFQRIGTNLVASIGHTLQAEAMRIEQQSIELQDQGDDRLYRAHLMIEELGECLVALSKADFIEFVDGLADSLYVIIGTAVANGIPIHAVFNEVHDSNMSKPTRSETDPRMRKREGTYFKPRIREVLADNGMYQCEACGAWTTEKNKIGGKMEGMIEGMMVDVCNNCFTYSDISNFLGDDDE